MPIFRLQDATISELRYRESMRSFQRTALVLLATVVICTVGLYLLDSKATTADARLLDALWNAANTVSTLGSLGTLNEAQKLFMIMAMLTLVGISGYALTSLIGILSQEYVQIHRENKRMEKVIAKLESHMILVGFGDVGRSVAKKLKAAGETVLVVDRDAAAAGMASHLGYLVVQGAVSQDGVLEQAGTDQAKAIIVSIDDPDRMLAATLMARHLNRDILIYVISDSGAQWLMHAGASDVVFADDVIANELINRLNKGLAGQTKAR